MTDLTKELILSSSDADMPIDMNAELKGSRVEPYHWHMHNLLDFAQKSERRFYPPERKQDAPPVPSPSA